MEKIKAMTMKQYNQSLENIAAKAIFNAAFDELDAQQKPVYSRLRNCTAWVFETENYYLLKSYETFIACIRKADYLIIDELRDVYHYTVTSGQHISKFIHDYTPYPWNSPRYTYRDI